MNESYWRLRYWFVPLLIALTIFHSGGPVHAQCRIDKSNWELFWSEEFNSKAEVLSKGQFRTEVNQYLDYDDPSNPDVNIAQDEQLVVFGGAGQFNAQKKDFWTWLPNDPKHAHIIANNANLVSTFDELPDFSNDGTATGFLYGMFEIRCKMPRNFRNQLSAFWATGNIWPPEWDAFEYFAGLSYWMTSDHFYEEKDGKKVAGKGCSSIYETKTFKMWEDWHTWTVVWTPTVLSFFLDGVELKTDTNPNHLPNQNFEGATATAFFTWNKMNIRVGMGINGLLDLPEDPYFDPLLVDYVRVFKPKGYRPFQWKSTPDEWYHDYLAPLYAGTPYVIHKNSGTSPCPNINPICDQDKWIHILLTQPGAGPGIVPNPTSDEFTIIMQREKDERVDCIITNARGEAILRREIRSDEDLKFSMGSQPPGVYFVSIKSSKVSSVLKLLKQ